MQTRGFLLGQKVKVGNDLGIIKSGVLEGGNSSQKVDLYKVLVFTSKKPKGEWRILSINEIESI